MVNFRQVEGARGVLSSDLKNSGHILNTVNSYHKRHNLTTLFTMFCVIILLNAIKPDTSNAPLMTMMVQFMVKAKPQADIKTNINAALKSLIEHFFPENCVITSKPIKLGEGESVQGPNYGCYIKRSRFRRRE